jgi:hypothetical protein
MTRPEQLKQWWKDHPEARRLFLSGIGIGGKIIQRRDRLFLSGIGIGGKPIQKIGRNFLSGTGSGTSIGNGVCQSIIIMTTLMMRGVW